MIPDDNLPFLCQRDYLSVMVESVAAELSVSYIYLICAEISKAHAKTIQDYIGQ
jgi:hypothetical protein